jgi:hypothetical protein
VIRRLAIPGQLRKYFKKPHLQNNQNKNGLEVYIKCYSTYFSSMKP